MRALFVLILSVGATAAPNQTSAEGKAAVASKPVAVAPPRGSKEDILIYADILHRDHSDVVEKAKEVNKAATYSTKLVDLLFTKENRLRSSHASISARQGLDIPVEVLVLMAIAKIILVVILTSTQGGLTERPNIAASTIQAAGEFFSDNRNLIEAMSAVIAVMPGLTPVAFPENSVALDPKVVMSGTAATAVVRIDAVSAEIYFAQIKEPTAQGNPMTIVSGAIDGLKPGSHTLRIHRSGDVTDGCSRVGEMFSSVGGRSMEVDVDGRAVLLMRESDVPLVGERSVMGRSFVIRAASDGTAVCGVITQT